MSQKVDISVIVPIYNSEKYLEKCLNSIKAQTFQNFNVIMIDDESGDGSGEIAKSFCDSDSRFIYKRLRRGGVSRARNEGLKLADGEYIAFVDSDDTVEPEYLRELFDAAVKNNCKISSCNYSLVTCGKREMFFPRKLRRLKSGVYDNNFYMRHLLEDWDVRSYLWNKLWHRSLFFDNDITFPIMFFEDVATVARLAYYADRVAVTDKPLYNYYMRKNSIMTSARVEKINDYVMAYGMLKCFFHEKGELDKYRLNFFRLAWIIFFANYYNIFQLHLSCRSFCGWFRNQNISDRNLFYFMNDKNISGKPKMSRYVINPWDYRK